MFQEISLAGLKKSKAFGYAAEVPFFTRKKKLSFKPGLNILFGPNGCGKSTVLQILARTTCAAQGGLSVVTESVLHDNVDMLGRLRNTDMTSKLGLHVAHDGQPVVFCDPRAKVGLIGGSFDDDFFSAGVAEMTQHNRRSHGQASLSRANVALAILLGQAPFPKEVQRRINRDMVNDVWGRALDVVEDGLKGTIAPGQPSVLLDEPEANFSLLWQSRIWDLLAKPEMATKFQVIVATHSPFALGIAQAHYIDFVEGFRQECEAALRKRFA